MTDPARNAAPPSRNDLRHVDRLIREGQLADAYAALVSAEPGDIEPAARELRLSRVAAMRKETEASDRHARQAAELLGPKTRESLVGYVNAVLNMTDRDAAELCMTALASRFPRHAEPVFGLARLAARAGAHDRALSLAADGLVRDPGHWQLHRFRLLELIRTGRNAEIDACAATIEEVFGESDALRETREILTNRSATATAPAPERAAAPVETVAAILERARALMDAGETTDALGLLRREGAARGNDVNILLQEGEMREQIGDFEAAEVTYAKAAALYPQNPRPRILRSRLALRLQRNDDALVYADAAVAIAPTSPHAHLVRCDALSALDRREALAAAVAHLLTLSPDGGQLVRVARHCERLNLADTTAEVLRQGLMADVPAEPIVGHVMARAGSRVHPDILDRWTAALALVLPSTPYNRLMRRNLLENGHHEEVLGLVRRMPTRERDFREAGDLFEALMGLRRYRTAQRYASFAARFWPLQMVQRLFMLHVRFGELAEAAEVLERAERGHLLGSEVLAAMEHTLALHSRAPTDLVALALRSPAPGALLVHSLRYALGNGDIATARKALPLVRGHNQQRKLHWQSTLEGQMMNEVTQLAAMLGEETLNGIAVNGPDELKRHVTDHSWSIILATTYLTHYRPRPAIGGGPEAIPRIIHQFWDESPPPEDIAALMASWDGHGAYAHQVLSRRDAVQFLRAEYGEEWVMAFRLASNPAESADFLRLCLLARQGGVWIDADDEAAGDLDRLIGPADKLVAFREPIGGAVANNFVAACPAHPVLVSAATLAKRTLLARSSESTWAKTGPGLLTRILAQYLAQTGRTGDITLHEQSVLRREVAIHTPLAHKRGAKYWNASSVTDPVLTALVKSHTAALEARMGTAAADPSA